MNTLANRDQIAALREEIRRAGKSGPRRLAVLTAAGILVAFSGLAGLLGLLSVPHPVATAVTILLYFATPALLLVALACRALDRRLYCNLFGRKLAKHARAEQAHVLLPLWHFAVEETWEIIEPLVRRLQASAELVPAEAPAGRGDEPSPAGEQE